MQRVWRHVSLDMTTERTITIRSVKRKRINKQYIQVYIFLVKRGRTLQGVGTVFSCACIWEVSSKRDFFRGDGI